MNDQQEQVLELDPSVITNSKQDQDTQAIDSKYGISLFTNSEDSYELYDYEPIENTMFNNKKQYDLEIATDKFAAFYEEPAIYPVETSSLEVNYTTVVQIVLAIQLCIIIYFCYKIFKLKGRKNEKSYDQNKARAV